MDYYKLNHGIYPGVTYVYFNCEAEELIKHYHKRSKKKLDENSKKSLLDTKGGGLILHDTGTCVIYIPKFKNNSLYYGMITHELLHACFFILDYVGVDYNVNNQEPFTYLMEYLTCQLYDKTFSQEYK